MFDIVSERHAVFSGEDGIESRGLEAWRPGGTAGQQASHDKGDHDYRPGTTRRSAYLYLHLRYCLLEIILITTAITPSSPMSHLIYL